MAQQQAQGTPQAFNMAADSSHAPATTEAEALATTHRLKLKPPTYNGDYATFEEWKYKFNAYMGLIDATYPALLERAESATTRLTDMDLTVAANTTTEGDKWIQHDTTSKRPQVRQVHPDQHHHRPCSNSMQTTPTRDGTGNLPTTLQQIFHPIGNTQHRLPHQTSQANIRQQELRRVIRNMGVQTHQVRTRQWLNTPRSSQDCSASQ